MRVPRGVRGKAESPVALLACLPSPRRIDPRVQAAEPRIFPPSRLKVRISYRLVTRLHTNTNFRRVREGPTVQLTEARGSRCIDSLLRTPDSSYFIQSALGWIRTSTNMALDHVPLPIGLRGRKSDGSSRHPPALLRSFGGPSAPRRSRTCTAPVLKRLPLPLGYEGLRSSRRASNPQPPVYETGAQPVELQERARTHRRAFDARWALGGGAEPVCPETTLAARASRRSLAPERPPRVDAPVRTRTCIGRLSTGCSAVELRARRARAPGRNRTGAACVGSRGSATNPQEPEMLPAGVEPALPSMSGWCSADEPQERICEESRRPSLRRAFAHGNVQASGRPRVGCATSLTISGMARRPLLNGPGRS